MKVRQFRLWFAIPLLILIGSFLVICARFATPWPWTLVVHEDGERTLLGTIFYFEHALGELPEELILALALAGAAIARFRPVRNVRLCAAAGAAALSVDLLLLAAASARVGFSSAMTWLLQYHTRKEAPLVFGSHWRYHLLSEAALMLWAALLVGAGLQPQKLWIASWAAFGITTLVFGLNAAPFRDPAYLGHQARETLTHGLVTVPLAVGLLRTLSVVRPLAGAASALLPMLGICVLLVLYQVVGAALTGASQHAQTHDLAKLICVHFFEHTFSYIVVPLHALWFFLLAAREADA